MRNSHTRSYKPHWYVVLEFIRCFHLWFQEKKVAPNEKPITKGRSKVIEIKTKFSPEEVDLIPKTALFPSLLGCSLCPYKTKVRSNLLRHAHQHNTGDSVPPQEDVINPVPQKSEKMFDKMMNLALSSHKKVGLISN